MTIKTLISTLKMNNSNDDRFKNNSKTDKAPEKAPNNNLFKEALRLSNNPTTNNKRKSKAKINL
jgi:hypothetical protein